MNEILTSFAPALTIVPFKAPNWDMAGRIWHNGRDGFLALRA